MTKLRYEVVVDNAIVPRGKIITLGMEIFPGIWAIATVNGVSTESMSLLIKAGQIEAI